MNSSFDPTIVVVPRITTESDFHLLRDRAARDFPPSFPALLALQDAEECSLREAGLYPRRVTVRSDAFLTWCERTNRPADTFALLSYAQIAADAG